MSETADVLQRRESVAPGIREVSVEFSRTVNLGNFESVRVQVGLVSMVAEGEDHRRLVEELALEAEDAALKELRRLAGQRREQRRREEEP